jgi:hypothetical protein
MKFICAAILIALLGQAKKENPDLKVDEQAGLSVGKMPKNDEWGFKDKPFFEKAKISVGHKVDDIGVDVFSVLPAPNQSGWDLKKQADSDFSAFSAAAGVTDMKKVSQQDKVGLPRGGGNGAVGTYMEMTFKRQEKPVEYRYWSFTSKSNNNFYLVIVHGDEGMYKKHQKIVDYILGTIQTWKLPK